VRGRTRKILEKSKKREEGGTRTGLHRRHEGGGCRSSRWGAKRIRSQRGGKLKTYLTGKKPTGIKRKNAAEGG